MTDTTTRSPLLAIAETIGVDDPDTLRLVERWMLDDNGGRLDHLDGTAFARLARSEFQLVLQFAATDPETVRISCAQSGIGVPGWVK